MKLKIRSYVNKKGLAFYRKTGRYNETTREAIGAFSGKNVSRALDQKNLAPPGSNSAAVRTLRMVRKELGW